MSEATQHHHFAVASCHHKVAARHVRDTSKRDGKLLLPILSLCRDHDGDSLLGLAPEAENHIGQVADLNPGCVMGIVAYWGRKGSKQLAMWLKAGSRPTSGGVTTEIGIAIPLVRIDSGQKRTKRSILRI